MATVMQCSSGGVAQGGRKRGSRRSLWAGQGGEEKAVAAVVGSDGGSLFGGAARERAGEGKEIQGERGEDERVGGVCVAPYSASRASAASRSWRGACSRAVATRPSSSWQEEEDDRGGGDGLGCP